MRYKVVIELDINGVDYGYDNALDERELEDVVCQSLQDLMRSDILSGSIVTEVQ
jgi:hypothetical protein